MATTASKNAGSLVSVTIIDTTIPREFVQRLADFLAQVYLSKPKIWIVVRSSRKHSTQFNSSWVSVQHGDIHFDYTVAKRTTVEQLYALTVDALRSLAFSKGCSFTAALRTSLERSYQNAQPQLGIIWAMPPAPPKPRPKRAKLTLVQRRAQANREKLEQWKKRMKYAITKVKAYQKKVRYYESKGVQLCDS